MRPVPILFALALTAAVSGCSRYRPGTLPAPEETPVTLNAARVTPRGAGWMVVLRDVRITADSVTGWRAGDPDPSGWMRGPRQRVALARDEVLVFEPAQRDPWATAGVVALGVVVTYAVAALTVVAMSDP